MSDILEYSAVITVNVTANKNWPSSYRFTQANQRNPWTTLDWTSQIPLKMMFSSGNNLG